MWQIPNLKLELKQMILSTSARALKLSQRNPNFYESYINIHTACNRALPNQFILYKHSILLYKMYNSYCPEMDWVELNFNQTTTSHQTLFNVIKSNNFQVGNNLLVTRLYIYILNNKIPLDDHNMSFSSFKVKYKGLYLTNAP